MRTWFSRLLLVCAVLGLVAFPTLADLTGDVQGTVLDAAGAAVAGAKVTIKNVSTGATRTLVTNQSGEFSSPQMEIADYLVTIEKDGFRSFTETVTVRSGEKTRLEAKMQVGNVNETVIVEGGATPTLDVATAQVSDSINGQEALALPNQARDP